MQDDRTPILSTRTTSTAQKDMARLPWNSQVIWTLRITCRNTTAQQAYPVHWHSRVHLHRTARVDNRVLTEAWHCAVMVHRFPLDWEAGLLITVHDTLPLQTELLAHIAFPRNTVLAAHTFPNEDREYVVSHLEFGHPFTNTLDYSTDQRCSNVRIVICKQLARLSSKKRDQDTDPDASCPKILGSRSGCACVLEQVTKARWRQASFLFRNSNEWRETALHTLDCHWVTSLRQMEVETTLTRISMAPGGATSTCSITSACPGPHATAAARTTNTEEWGKTHIYAAKQ